MARWIFAGILLPAMLVLGIAESRRQFVHVEGRASDGSAVLLRAAPEAELVGSELRVVARDGERRLELRLPGAPSAADHLVTVASLEDASGVHAGRATVDIEESGTFLAGRVRGSAGDFVFSGGLRIRRP